MGAGAIVIGASHGAYKFTRQPTGDILDIERIGQIHRASPDPHLVMHGSFSVPQEWLEIIRQFGGDIKETYGVPVDQIRRGIESGVRKVLAAATRAARGICEDRFEAFGCTGMAPNIKPVPLEAVAAR